MAEEIRKLMFVFEDLIYIDDRGMQELLKAVPNDKLTMAMKTAPEDIKEKIFRNMSKRASDMLREDLETMGPVKVSEVDSAQQEIVNIAKKLEGEGKLFVARGGEGDALV